MNIIFTPLNKQHFGLLLKWLQTPHVKEWWNKDVNWTPQLIEEKYSTYVEGYKQEGNTPKPIFAFIISVDEKPVGYIQMYNAYDFPREDGISLEGLPNSLAAIDYFIGDPQSLGKGIGSHTLKLFLHEHVFPAYKACFVDPDRVNTAAIRAYEKAGFRKVKEVQDGKVTWVINDGKR